MADKRFDYLILGQGLAGTALAWHLIAAGKKVLITGDATKPSSSLVAAGIFNPLTGKKLVRTWLADDIFPYAHQFYSKIGAELGATLIHDLPIYRPYRSVEEQNTYIAATGEPELSKYVSDTAHPVDLSHYIHCPHGGLEVVGAGWVDLPMLIEKSRSHFMSLQMYVEGEFHVSDLKLTENGLEWLGHTFGKVVFCQGFMALENDFFNWLPFTPVKGQLIDITLTEAVPEYIINQGIFMLPGGKTTLRVGATYSWDPLDWEPTEEATAELESKFREVFKLDYKVQTARAGVRPAVRDRRPLIGVHPEWNNVAIFNGLGTKGVTLAPFFANQLVNHLETGKELNPLVNIKRYFSLYFR